MILFDTNVILDALFRDSQYFDWSINLITSAAGGEGAAINAITVAELCAGDRRPETVEADLRGWNVHILDVPAVAAAICGKAYRRYAAARRASGGGPAPKIPLPDFFIGAHAEVMGWKLATRDADRIHKYFPKVQLLTP
jgi:predicted nucleic acid-binding protein